MSEKDPNLEWNVWSIDLGSIDVSQWQELQNVGQVDESSSWSVPLWSSDSLDVQGQDASIYSDAGVEGTTNVVEWGGSYSTVMNTEVDGIDTSKLDLEIENTSSTIDENLFLDSWDNVQVKRTFDEDWGHFGKYLRLFFFASILIILWVGTIVLFYFFDRYITEASKPTVPVKQQGFVDWFKEKLKGVKWFFNKDYTMNYQTPSVLDDLLVANKIIDAKDLDYVEKKDILAPYVAELVRDAETNAVKIETLKHDIARQWFLPDELDKILSKDQAIDTIQRSLNALEVIKFSTATKVYSYMNSALQTISDMVRVNWSSADAIYKLFTQLSSRWENDISSYVYMCYLNPFETKASCEDIGDLDMYYSELKKEQTKNCKKDPNCKELDMIDIKLFKNAMNAIDQLLEAEQTALFSITFNGFNAQDKNITFNIEVYTNQNDEKNLMEKGKRNPNIFILTSIVNLLKQSSFIIWADISTKEVNVETKSLDLWWFTVWVNYSSQEFTVPIQKDTEREIFDYIDLDSIIKLLKWEKVEDEEIIDDSGDFSDEQVDDEDLDEDQVGEGLGEDEDQVDEDLDENDEDLVTNQDQELSQGEI